MLPPFHSRLSLGSGLSPRNQKLLIFAGILFFLYLAHLPALHGHYVFHDDVLFWEDSGPWPARHPQNNIAVAMGRPIAAGLLCVWGWMVREVGDLNFLRFVSLFQLGVSALLCFLVLKKGFLSPLAAVLTAVVIFTLPPFQVMVFWAGVSFDATAVMLASLAGYMTCAIPAGRPFRENLRSKYFLLAVVLLAYALLTYAPGAGFYWAFLALVVLSFREGTYGDLRKTVWNFLLVGLAAGGLYAVFLAVIKNYAVKLVRGMYNPYLFNTDYFAKLKWFLSEPFVNALNLWNIFPSKIIAGSVLFLMAVPFLHMLVIGEIRESPHPPGGFPVRREMFYVFTFLLLTVLSFLPNLVSTGESPFYRCLAGLMPLVFIMLVWALVIWVKVLAPRNAAKVLNALLLVCAVAALAAAHRTILLYRVIPSRNELKELAAQLKQLDLRAGTLAFTLKEVPPAQRRYDEYGVLTMSFPQDVKLMIECARREAGL